jgi:DNA-binding NarL/FixJ family response regulator
MENWKSRAPIQILLLEDQNTTRHIIYTIIAADPELQLAASFTTSSAGLGWLQYHSPDVLIVDLMLGDGSGIDVMRYCANRYPTCAILVLTCSGDTEKVDASIKAGALGYLLKDDGLHILPKAIKELMYGGSPVSAFVARRLFMLAKEDQIDYSCKPETSSIKFTERERTVLKLIALGMTYEEIGNKLFISVATVQNYIKRLYRKLSVNSRAKAAIEARKLGIID